MKVWQFLIDYKDAIGLLLLVAYEVIVRLAPTSKSYSIITLLRLLVSAIPDRKAGGGTHNADKVKEITIGVTNILNQAAAAGIFDALTKQKNSTGTVPNPDKEVTSLNGSAGSTVPVILTILFSGMLLAGCTHKAIPAQTTVKDSIVTKVVTQLKDTTIYLPGADIYFSDTIPCPDVTLSNLAQKGYLTSAVKLSKGVLTVDCKADSLTQRITWLESQLTTIHKSTTIIKIPVPGPEVVKYRVPKWCWWLVAICVVYLVIKYWRFFGGVFGWLLNGLQKLFSK